MFVENIIAQARERLVTVGIGACVKDAAGLMTRPRTGLVVVCSDGVAVGVVTKTDIVAHASRQVGSAFDAPVASIMARDPTYCRASDSLLDVWQVMKERGFQRIPVVDERHSPVGIVHVRDVLQGLLREVEIEDEMLRDYIFGVGYQ